MTHDVLGLRIVARFLMERLDRWHALSLFRCFDAISQNDQASSHLKRSKQHKTKTYPARGQDIKVQGLAVKEMKKAVVGLGAKVQHPHKTSNPKVVAAATQTDED